MSDQPKAIISTSIGGVLGWHIWTTLSLRGTFTLLYLNFKKVSSSGELGNSSISTANVLGVLQMVVKLAIVASLVAIAKPCLLRDLLGQGLLLGLLGAEGALANSSFLISSRFRLALKFGIRSLHPRNASANDPDNLRTLWLVVLIFFSCVIAVLVGPSSAVLMIPRVGWFH